MGLGHSGVSDVFPWLTDSGGVWSVGGDRSLVLVLEREVREVFSRPVSIVSTLPVVQNRSSSIRRLIVIFHSSLGVEVG